MIMPTVGKVVRLNTYAGFGEPVYWARVNGSYNVKKA